VYKTTDSLDGKPNIAYYVIADLKDKRLDFTTDTTHDRRITPQRFYERNNNPLIVVNCTFFSYETNRSLNTVIKDGKLVGYNTHSVPGRGKDTLTYRHPLGSAIGISKKRNADVAWMYTDSLEKYPYASQWEVAALKDSFPSHDLRYYLYAASIGTHAMKPSLEKWKMKTAVGGGPVLLQNGEIKITNNEELKFAGKAIEDKHPRTAMGYTKDNRLVILLIQGRFPGIAEGATLTQEAQLLKNIGCLEALNLDGGGSSCLLVNGKETIKPSDKEGQRPVPAVFVVKIK
jgi:exopolysaccharide biosynthesis protein